MPCEEAKFCLDLNQVYWTLLEGVTMHKNQHDSPLDSKQLPLQQVTSAEEIELTKVYRSRLARSTAPTWANNFSPWGGYPIPATSIAMGMGLAIM